MIIFLRLRLTATHHHFGRFGLKLDRVLLTPRFDSDVYNSNWDLSPSFLFKSFSLRSSQLQDVGITMP